MQLKLKITVINIINSTTLKSSSTVSLLTLPIQAWWNLYPQVFLHFIFKINVTCATFIHRAIYLPLMLGPLLLLSVHVSMEEMTRRDTALNWSTVALTVSALPSFLFLPHTHPRQCQAITLLNSF